PHPSQPPGGRAGALAGDVGPGAGGDSRRARAGGLTLEPRGAEARIYRRSESRSGGGRGPLGGGGRERVAPRARRREGGDVGGRNRTGARRGGAARTRSASDGSEPRRHPPR